MGLVSLPLKKGENSIHVLLDNLGRANYTEGLGETKGIRGPVYLGARRLPARCSWTAPRYNGRLADTWQVETFWPKSKGVAATLSVVFERKSAEGVTLRLQNVAEPAAIFVNRRFHSYFWGARELSKLDLTLSAAQLAAGRNLIELAFFVAPDKRVSSAVSLFAFDDQSAVKGPWWFAAFDAPSARGSRPGSRATGVPAAWETSFTLEAPAAPVVLVPDGLKKGEIWLNGRMVSRHWNVGPQRRAYLPEPWLKGKNTLVIVDEFGSSPSKVRLEYDPFGILHTETV
jgi:hypothetical protein